MLAVPTQTAAVTNPKANSQRKTTPIHVHVHVHKPSSQIFNNIKLKSTEGSPFEKQILKALRRINYHSFFLLKVTKSYLDLLRCLALEYMSTCVHAHVHIHKSLSSMNLPSASSAYSSQSKGRPTKADCLQVHQSPNIGETDFQVTINV